MSQKLINWYDNAEIIENENSIGFGYYLLKVSKCKYDGEIDQSKPYFKLISILELKRNNILNLSNFDNNVNTKILAFFFKFFRYIKNKFFSKFQ